MYTVRPLTEHDLVQLLHMIKELAAFERLESMVSASEAGLRECLLGEDPCAEVLVAVEGEAACGYAVFYPTMSTFLGSRGLFIEDIYVRPAERGKGVGTMLFERVAALAAERGCGRLEWAVLDWNERAQAFYRRQGAGALDEWSTFRLEGSALAAAAERGQRRQA